jgi:3',5'-cyclic AMP phosphodiesterase CpdA
MIAPRLWAIADLHLGNAANAVALSATPDHGHDWLVVAGDVGETAAHLDQAFDILRRCFVQVIWVPGNHELWTTDLRGQAKYESMIATARAHGVATPEDPYLVFTGENDRRHVIVPLFLLYDYSFRPPEVTLERMVAWAAAARSVSGDEVRLDPAPFPDRPAWCAARCALSAARLDAVDRSLPTVLVNHFPLRCDTVFAPAVPRFSPWCGTVRTEDWHRRYRATAVVYGHLHLRRTVWRDGTRFEEVSLGYPGQWRAGTPVERYLRRIL